MNNHSKDVVGALIHVGKLDAKLSRIEAEKKKLENDFVQMRQALLAQEEKLNARKKQLEEKQARYQREERLLRDEREKLVNRRKSLESLGSFKLQQAAQREIEHASRQLDVHEEGLIKILEETGQLEGEIAEAQTVHDKSANEFQDNARQINQALHAFDSSEEQSASERAAAIVSVPPDLLKSYDRVREKFLYDPLAAIVAGDSCSGCHMKVGPQVVVKVARGEGLIKCPGCGRILYLEDSKEE